MAPSSVPSRRPSAEFAWRELKKQNPQKTIDGFWKNFMTKQPGKVFRVLPEDLYAKRAAANAPKDPVSANRAAASYDAAVVSCRAKVDKIIRECRKLNIKYTDPHFDIELDLKCGQRDCLNGLIKEEFVDERRPRSVKRVSEIFENPRFFVNGATAGDVRQGREGDCWLMAALSTLTNDERLVQKICVARDEVIGVYGFVFHRDGEWISSIVDDKLYLIKPDYDESFEERQQWDDHHRVNGEEEYQKAYQTGSGALYFAQCSDPNETWVPLLEKAYAKAHGDYSSIIGGDGGEALEDLTGGVSTEIYTSSILDKEVFWSQELMKANKEALFSCFTGIFGGWGQRKGIQEMHEYSVLRAVETHGERLLLLRNPWGKTEWTGPWSDGSREWTPEWMQRLNHRFGDDGTFWISYKDLLRKYQCMTRTRLFGPEWSVTQQWTSLNVPWSVDYHDTKFAFELTKPGPVVIVLSQLDDRYFRGLEGQYHFKLHFRLHKDGEDDYVVRSLRNYTLTRSVSTEVELESGHYSVLIKVDAARSLKLPAPEDVVRNTCRSKREKLLQIGLSYDLAHAKGQVKETEAEKKRRRQARAAQKREQIRKELAAARAARAKEKRKAKERAARKAAKNTSKRRHAQATRHKHGEASTKQLGVTEQENAGQAGRHHFILLPTHGRPRRLASAKDSVASVVSDDRSERASAHAHGSVNGIAEAEHEADAAANGPVAVGESAFEKGLVVRGQRRHGHGHGHGHRHAEERSHTDAGEERADSRRGSIHVGEVEEEDSDDESVSSSLLTPSVVTSNSEESDARSTAQYEDDFAKAPWNAVCVVGLRVYSKDQGVRIEVVRPRGADTEQALDPDDLAADAAKDGREPNELEKSKVEGANDAESLPDISALAFEL